MGEIRASERKNGIFKEILAEYSPIQGKHLNLQTQETQQIPSRINIKETTLWYIIVKILKTKKAARENSTLYANKHWFEETLTSQKQWQPEYNGTT